MLSFQQCTSCKTFLISSDPSVATSHAALCFSHKSDDDTIKEDADLTLSEKGREMTGLEDDNFHQVSFPEARIRLERMKPPEEDECQSSSSFELSENEYLSSSSYEPSPTHESKKKTVKKRKRQQATSSAPRKKPKRVRPISAPDPNGEPFIRNYSFDCDQCPGRFYSKVEFDRHMNVHTGSRKLMNCIVCLRMFNKRDSLNQHYAAHENAEERQENLNLMSSWPKKTSENPYARVRQACKYCLLVHTNQASFVSHMESDHGGDLSVFPCGLGKCPLKFSKIRELLQHAKEKHPLLFYGKFTLNRMKGLYVSGGKPIRRDPDRSPYPYPKLLKTKAKKHKPRRKKRKMSSSDSDDEEQVVNFDRMQEFQECSDIARNIELERVHIVDEPAEGPTVKKEHSGFYSSYPEDLDPFLLQQMQELEGTLHVTGGSETDSVPIVLGIKREPIL